MLARENKNDGRLDSEALRANSRLLRPPPMYRPRLVLRLSRSLSRRTYATATSPHALVFIEHNAGVIESGSLAALTAASKLGGKVTGLIVGAPEEVKQSVEKAKRYASGLYCRRRLIHDIWIVASKVSARYYSPLQSNTRTFYPNPSHPC